jgi:WASH complex subunit 7
MYYKLFASVPFSYPLKIIARSLVLLLTLDTMVNESLFYNNTFI